MTLPKYFGKPKKPRLIVRRVTGHSMAPALQDGQLIVAIAPKRLRTGTVVVVRHDDLEKIKRVQQLRPNQLFIVGDNPGISTDSRHFGWVDEGAVMGTVVWPRLLV